MIYTEDMIPIFYCINHRAPICQIVVKVKFLLLLHTTHDRQFIFNHLKRIKLIHIPPWYNPPYLAHSITGIVRI